MIWECSECGERIIRLRPPIVCRDCGTAGAIFVHADVTEPNHDPDNLQAAWLRAGMEHAVWAGGKTGG
jgi:hypothetical protein